MPLSVANFARSMKPPLFREDPTVFESSQYLIFSRIMKQIITLLDHYVEKVHPPTRLGKKKKKRKPSNSSCDGRRWLDRRWNRWNRGCDKSLNRVGFVRFFLLSLSFDGCECVSGRGPPFLRRLSAAAAAATAAAAAAAAAAASAPLVIKTVGLLMSAGGSHPSEPDRGRAMCIRTTFYVFFFSYFYFPPPPLYMWLCVCVFVFFSWATDESAQNETLNPPVNGNHWFRFQNKKLCQRSEILPNFLKRLLPGVTYSSSVIFIDSALFLP